MKTVKTRKMTQKWPTLSQNYPDLWMSLIVNISGGKQYFLGLSMAKSNSRCCQSWWKRTLVHLTNWEMSYGCLKLELNTTPNFHTHFLRPWIHISWTWAIDTLAFGSWVILVTPWLQKSLPTILTLAKNTVKIYPKFNPFNDYLWLSRTQVVFRMTLRTQDDPRVTSGS